MAKFGQTLMEGFGLTETSPIVALNLPWAHKAGSVGKIDSACAGEDGG